MNNDLQKAIKTINNLIIKHKKMNSSRGKLEGLQVAAMSLRFIGECCDETTGRK